MSYELTGRIEQIGQLKTGTSQNGKDWKTRLFVIREVKDQYPASIAVEFFGDKSEINLPAGTLVKVKFDLEAKEYNGRYFQNVRGYSIEAVSQAAAPAPAKPAPKPATVADPFGEHETEEAPF